MTDALVQQEPLEVALYICGTPIGNVEDASPRLKRVIRDCDLIASEDTRRTRTLLSALGVKLNGRKILSVRADNERSGSNQIVDALRSGKSVAYMSDAGMPVVSDPGGILVRAARNEGFRVSMVPGPCAVSTALAASGILQTCYTFVGFFPRSARDLKQIIEDHAHTTIVGFESPRRCSKTIAIIAERQPKRVVSICRELTKVHESIVSGEAQELLAANEPSVDRGEFTLVLDPLEVKSTSSEKIEDRYLQLVEDLNIEGISLKDATRIVARRFADDISVSRKHLYDAVLRRREEPVREQE